MGILNVNRIYESALIIHYEDFISGILGTNYVNGGETTETTYLVPDTEHLIVYSIKDGNTKLFRIVAVLHL